MKRMLILAVAILGSSFSGVSAQEGGDRVPPFLQDEPPRIPAEVRELHVPNARQERSDDLWYGTPGVRPGGDLLGPIIDLVRKPSSLFDFRLRKVPSYLPDRETAESFRERR